MDDEFDFDAKVEQTLQSERTKRDIGNFNRQITLVKKELFAIFEDSDEDVKKVASQLIDKVSYMKVELDNLKKYNIEHGIKEVYMNGRGQFGYKESVESKTYNTMFKNYLSAIKLLNDMLPKGKSIPTDDGFDSFGDN